MVLSPRQAVQQVNDKLEEWWGRFVTPDIRRQRNDAVNDDDNDHDDDDNDNDDILLNGAGDGDDDDDDDNGGTTPGRRVSLLVKKLFQEARLFPRPQFMARHYIPQLPPLFAQLQLTMIIPSRQQLGEYCAQLRAQVETLPPPHSLFPRRDQLPSMQDVGQFASNCWEEMETRYDENKLVYKQRLTWSSFIVVYLVAMLLLSSQCCCPTSPPPIAAGSSSGGAASSAVEVVHNPDLQQQQKRRYGRPARNQQQGEGGEQQQQKKSAVAAGRKWILSWLLSTTSIPAVDESFGKNRPRDDIQRQDVDSTASSSSSSSSSLSVSTTTVRQLDGACASTSLSASNKRNNNTDDDITPPPPPLWFTFVRSSNQASSSTKQPPPALPPIALRMVKDVDGYYVDEEEEQQQKYSENNNHTVLPPPSNSTIKKTTPPAASFLKSMDVAGVNIAMEEEKDNNGMSSLLLYPSAFSTQPLLRKQDVGFLHAWSRRITTEIPDIQQRSLSVSWGGGVSDGGSGSGGVNVRGGGDGIAGGGASPCSWWQERQISSSSSKSLHVQRTSYFSWWKSYSSSMAANTATAKDPLQDIDGGHLLYSYYQVMLPQFIKDPSKVTFPRHLNHNANLCSSPPPENGCSTQVAIRHTLEFRESYQPWRPTPSMVKENEQGWIYTRGLAKPASAGSLSSTKDKDSTNNNNNNSAMNAGQHAMIWARPGQHSIKDPQAYNRAILQTLEQGIATSLHHSRGQVGRFNVVIDASGFEWSKLPDLAVMKQLLHILQDHYPGRLGAIFMFNLSPPALVFLTLILKTFIDREVRQKIYLLSRNPVQRLAQLESVVDIQDIPNWIPGGQDSYEFDANAYYNYASSPNTWLLDDDFD